jgi:hypothetical protein
MELEMSSTVAVPVRTRTRSSIVPWYIWCSVTAVTSAMVGAHWDISWHRSIGRDTFWTPAHIAIYMCGVLAGLACGYLILATTFGHVEELKDASVKIWGFRGPLGAFLSAWGGLAMLTSAPFDDWWHSAYGLDVKIVSPPHVVLIAGILAIETGTLILILGAMNRAVGRLKRRLDGLFLYIGAMIVVLLTILTMEYTDRSFLHGAEFYLIMAITIPVVLAGVSRASGNRWAATVITGIYTLFLLGMEWILPLFPAQPKLGPVFHPVTQFIPPEFPLLLIAPAVVLDWLWQKLQDQTRWVQSVIAGSAFLAVLLAVEWPFADFLMSPGARNWFFGSIYFDYFTGPDTDLFQNRFEPSIRGVGFWSQMAWAAVVSILMTRLGLAWGEWMRRVRR